MANTSLTPENTIEFFEAFVNNFQGDKALAQISNYPGLPAFGISSAILIYLPAYTLFLTTVAVLWASGTIPTGTAYFTITIGTTLAILLAIFAYFNARKYFSSAIVEQTKANVIQAAVGEGVPAAIEAAASVFHWSPLGDSARSDYPDYNEYSHYESAYHP